MSRYELARESDVSEAVLCRFVNGKSGLSMESLDKVADVLGLEVVVRRGMPRTAAQTYNAEFVPPNLMPPANANLDDLVRGEAQEPSGQPARRLQCSVDAAPQDALTTTSPLAAEEPCPEPETDF